MTLIKQTLCFTLCSLALAACSSGGGGSSNQSQIKLNNSTPPKTNNTSNPALGGANYLVRQDGSNQNLAHNLSFNDSANIRQMTVNGITFDLARVGTPASFSQDWSSGRAQVPQGVNSVLIFNGSNNVTVGIVSVSSEPSNPKSQYLQDYAFFNGKFTDIKQIPQNGTVNYTGRAVYRAYVNQSQSNSELPGLIDLTADFDKKTLTGSVKRAPLLGGNIDLEAQIQGNGFESTKGASTAVKGGFFGDNAAEIGGIFQNSNTIGAFHGKRK